MEPEGFMRFAMQVACPRCGAARCEPCIGVVGAFMGRVVAMPHHARRHVARSVAGEVVRLPWPAQWGPEPPDPHADAIARERAFYASAGRELVPEDWLRSRWASRAGQARLAVACPRCGAEAGAVCVSSQDGRPCRRPHVERVA